MIEILFQEFQAMEAAITSSTAIKGIRAKDNDLIDFITQGGAITTIGSLLQQIPVVSNIGNFLFGKPQTGGIDPNSYYVNGSFFTKLNEVKDLSKINWNQRLEEVEKKYTLPIDMTASLQSNVKLYNQMIKTLNTFNSIYTTEIEKFVTGNKGEIIAKGVDGTLYGGARGRGAGRGSISDKEKRVLNMLTDLGIITWREGEVVFNKFALIKDYGTTTKLTGQAPENLINGYEFLTQLPIILNAIEKEISDIFNSFIVLQMQERLNSSSTITLPSILENPNTLTGDETLEELFRLALAGKLGTELANYVLSITRSAVRTRTKTQKAARERMKRKRRLKRKKKKKKKPQKRMIRTITVDTNDVSEWIASVSFTFPTKKDIDSDDKGTMIFKIKGGGMVRFVRVKRGTFSVISQVYGTGYRVWSQFWKHRIVNRTVLSWFIKRINANDRELAIPQEINDPNVKYK